MNTHYRAFNTKSSGAALILVLGVLSIISVLSVQIIESTHNLTRAQASQSQLQQSYWYAKSGEEYAKLISKGYLYKRMLHGEHTQLRFPISDGSISITLKPLQNCFNMNSLSQRSAINIINRVMFDAVDNPNTSGDLPKNLAEQALDENLLGIPLKRRQIQSLFSLFDISADRAQLFSDRIIDWLDEDNIPTGSYGAENTYYAGSNPAREAPNQHLLISQEMQHFLGDEHLDFTAVAALFCSHPGDNKLQVNINQLEVDSAVLISALLLEKIDLNSAQQIIKDRPQDGFESMAEFWKLPAFNGLTISIMQKKAFSIENRYFQVISEVNYKDSKFTLQSLIRVNTNKEVHVISRTYGVNS